jgi:hypothetical protein
VAYERSLDSYNLSAKVERISADDARVESDTDITLAEVSESYTGEKLRAGAWVKKTEDERAEHISLLQEILGSKTGMKTLTPQHAKKVKDVLFQLPKNRRKSARTRDLSLADAIALADTEGLSVKSLQDLGGLFAGIEYLRYLDGEKHLVYVSEFGLQMPSGDYDVSIANLASDARVVVDVIHTGGVTSSFVRGLPRANWNHAFSLDGLKTLASRTGGRASLFVRRIPTTRRRNQREKRADGEPEHRRSGHDACAICRSRAKRIRRPSRRLDPPLRLACARTGSTSAI